MAVDTQQIMQEAEKVGQLVAQHAAVARYKQAQKSLADDPDAARMMADFERQLDNLARQEQAGMPVSDAQRMQVESLQGRIVSNIKIKAFNVAQMEFVDLLRKVSETMRRQVSDPGGPPAPGPASAQAPAGGLVI